VPVEAPLRHEPVVRGLWRAARADRLPHALLFQGPRGIGKYTAARWLTLGLFCERGVPEERAQPCGACPPCKQVLAGSHPDVFEMRPLPGEERYHLKEFVQRDGSPARTAEDFLRLRAVHGGKRVLLVREMERTSHSQDETQNALLKMLEEPGTDVIWILECSRPDALLATIRSRCVAVRFESLTADEVASVLRASGLEGAEAEALSRWSRGSPGDALALRARGAVDLRARVVAALAGEVPLAAARAVWEVAGTFEGKTPRAKDRERARCVLDLALRVVGDQVRARAGADAAQLPHGDVPCAGAGTGLEGALEVLLEARADVERNLDPGAVLDRAFCALAEAGR
jgi:DNA polymerase-3 subunit delta'